MDGIVIRNIKDSVNHVTRVAVDVSDRELFASRHDREFFKMDLLHKLASCAAQNLIESGRFDDLIRDAVTAELKIQLRSAVAKRIDEFVEELASEL